MYEDHSVEEKYLYNFSDKEKKVFYQQQNEWHSHMNQYEMNLMSLIYLDSSEIFENWISERNSSLEIKYVLNRIAANDERDTALELNEYDGVLRADKLALHIAKSFQKNTLCKKIILHQIGLTDRGMLPLLRVLRHKELDFLDISGNKITDRTVSMITDILANPNTRWKEIRLGKVRLSQKQRESLKKYPNVSFVTLVPLSERLGKKCFRFLIRKLER